MSERRIHFPKLTIDRRGTAEALSCGVQTVLELERQGILTPLKLTGGKSAQTYYAFRQVEGLVEQRMREAEERQSQKAKESEKPRRRPARQGVRP